MSHAFWGWFWVILGSLLVGTGGSLATFGWNRVTAHDQRRNMIIGVAREANLNGRMIQRAMDLAARWPRRSEAENFSYEVYRSSHIAGAITSGRLDPQDSEDGELLAALEGYDQAVSRFNAALRIVNRFNPGIFIKVPLIHTADPKAWPVDLRDALADPFLGLLKEHEKTKALLEPSPLR
jgi:hypothetical protein